MGSLVLVMAVVAPTLYLGMDILNYHTSKREDEEFEELMNECKVMGFRDPRNGGNA